MIISKTPLRLSLLGGGTDYREYFDKKNGAVLGTTIKSIPLRLFIFPIKSSKQAKQNFSVLLPPRILAILDLEFPFRGHFENKINNLSFFILILTPIFFIFSWSCL